MDISPNPVAFFVPSRYLHNLRCAALEKELHDVVGGGVFLAPGEAVQWSPQNTCNIGVAPGFDWVQYGILSLMFCPFLFRRAESVEILPADPAMDIIIA